MGAKLVEGEQVRLLIIFINTNSVRGYSIQKQDEYTVCINPKQAKIQCGDVVAFQVSQAMNKEFKPGKFTNEGRPENVKVIESRSGDIQVLIDALVIFPSKLGNSSVCWSTEGYGWIYVPSNFMATTDILYRTCIIRKSDKVTQKHGCRFAIENVTEIQQIDENKKNLSFILKDLEEEVKDRLATFKPPKVDYRTALSDTRFKEPTLSNAKRDEEIKKAIANSISVFLVIDMEKSVNPFRGIAWCTALRAIGMNTLNLNGLSEPVKRGVWYEGVIKWRQRIKPYNGFYVEKIWKEHVTPPFKTSVDKQNRIIIIHEVSFPEKTECDIKREDNDFSTIYIPHNRFDKIAVKEKIYKQHMGTTRNCCLTTFHLVDSDYKNVKPADWIIIDVIEGNEDDYLKEMCSEEEQEKEEKGEGPPDDGGYPVESDDSNDEGDEENLNGMRRVRHFHDTQPKYGVERPQARYQEQRSDFNFPQKGKSDDWNLGEKFYDRNYTSYNNQQKNQDQKYSWNEDNYDNKFTSNRRQDFSSKNSTSSYRNDSPPSRSKDNWDRNENEITSVPPSKNSNYSRGYQDNTRRRQSPAPSSSDYGRRTQRSDFPPSFVIDYSEEIKGMSPCLCIDSSPDGSFFFSPGGTKETQYQGYCIIVPGRQFKLGAWTEMNARKLANSTPSGANYIGIPESVQAKNMPTENIFIIHDLLYMDVEIDMKYKKPIGPNNPLFSLHSLDIGQIISQHELLFEKGGKINLTDMANSPAGRIWRIWIRYNYYHGEEGYGYWRWDALKVRGPQSEIQELERHERTEILNIFDEIDIEKQRTHLFHYQKNQSQPVVKPLDRTGGDSSSSNSSYDKLNELSAGKPRVSISHGSRSSRESVDTVMSAQTSAARQSNIGYDQLLKLHQIFWNNANIQQSIKIQDYDAFVELETINIEARRVEEERDRYRPSFPSSASSTSSRFSGPRAPSKYDGNDYPPSNYDWNT